MKQKLKEYKGITLIALIITIIVLLILAVVAIKTVNGNGILAHARKAQKDYIDAQKKEEDLLKYYEGVLNTQEIMPTVAELQEKYEFSYYTTLSKAVEDVNAEVTTNADSEKENAVAGIYKDENNNVVVVLLKNTEEASKLTINKNVELNLGGNTLSFTTSTSGIVFGASTTATINGMLQGSKIESKINDAITSNLILIDAEGENFNLIGGEYVNSINSSKTAVLMKVKVTNEFYMKRCKIYSGNSNDSSGGARGMQVQATNAKLENSNIESTVVNGTADGIRIVGGKIDINALELKVNSTQGNSATGINNSGNTTVVNTNINCYSKKGQVVGLLSDSSGTTAIQNTTIEADTVERNMLWSRK